MIINVGCGMTPIEGALNVDNSFSVYLAYHRPLLWLLKTLRLLSQENIACAEFSRAHGIVYMDCTRMELPDGCADVLYASHMMEHLTRAQTARFLAEARRVLKPGGTLRLVLPDMRLLVEAYLSSHDCDRFVARTLLADETGSAFSARLRTLFFGYRGHRWMYDVPSVLALLSGSGFTDIRALPAGQTVIPEPDGINLSERADESLYVEAKPAG